MGRSEGDRRDVTVMPRSSGQRQLLVRTMALWREPISRWVAADDSLDLGSGACRMTTGPRPTSQP